MLSAALVSGLGLGSMYGLLAQGFYCTYAVSGTENFAQGSSLTLGAVLAFAFVQLWHWPFALAIVPVLLLCALYGCVVVFLAVRPFVKRGSDAWLMATVALGIVLDNVFLFTFGKEPRSLGSPLATTMYDIGGIRVSALQILIPIVGLALAAALHFASRRTRWGTAMIAVVQNRDAARLMGIPIAAVVMAAFAVSTLFAGIAGVMIAPLAAMFLTRLAALAASASVLVDGICLGTCLGHIAASCSAYACRGPRRSA
jgi:branched-chain amino acid transport system permease protein